MIVSSFGSNPQSTAGPTWVAVVKARTTPNIEEGWKLEVEESPVLVTLKRTMNSTTLDSAGIGPCRSNPMVGMRMAP